MMSPGSSTEKPKDSPEKVMERAQANARVEEKYRFDETVDFVAIRDHILPSVCRHVDGIVCQVCKYANELELPQLPEMIFPNNKLMLKVAGKDDFLIEFNAFDALERVDAKKLPDVEMAVRVRVMPTTFFVLCRFYLRVDNVMVKTCDTRLFGELDSNFILKEWTKREALYSDLTDEMREFVNDENVIWQSLPIIETKSWKIFLD
ncbi:hypothetical protein FO519_002439 [Halicephalobus sp. NKZ332]|nr:hypothetical protein FO519_002439 [Halicephalobus sp. NKZ332]